MSCIVSRLSILCISPAKQCDSTVTIHRVTATLTLNLFFNLPDIIEARSDPLYQNF